MSFNVSTPPPGGGGGGAVVTELTTFHRFLKFCCIKGKDQYWKRAPISTNEMEGLISNHVKEYVLTNT